MGYEQDLYQAKREDPNSMRRHSEAPNEGSWHGVVGRTSRRKQQHHASSRWDQIVATERNPTKHAPLKRSNPTRRETLRLRLALANRKLQSCPLRGIRWVCPATAPDSLVDCQTGFTRILLEKELRPWIHVGRSSNCLSLVESARWSSGRFYDRGTAVLDTPKPLPYHSSGSGR